MTDKKQLNEEQLEKANGGEYELDSELYRFAQSYVWIHSIGDVITFLIYKKMDEGIVTAQGVRRHNGSCIGTIYVECKGDQDLSGWYPDVVNKSFYSSSDEL